MAEDGVVNLKGKDYVLYPRLLAEAHKQGLTCMESKLLQAPADANDHLAIVHVRVVTEKGSFEGIGDASASNVGRVVSAHIVRMAETRAKARALRDALNIGVLLEGEDDTDGGASAGQAAAEVAAAVAAQAPVSYQYLMDAAKQIERDTGGVLVALPEEDTPEGNRAHLAFLRREWQRMTDGAARATPQQRQRIAALNTALGNKVEVASTLSTYGATRLINQLAVEQAQRAASEVPL